MKQPMAVGETLTREPWMGAPVLRLTVFVACLLLLGIPPVGAHMNHCSNTPDSLCHLTVTVKDLEPGAEHVYTLHSERITGDFPEGWLVTAFGGVQGTGAVTANLTLGN